MTVFLKILYLDTNATAKPNVTNNFGEPQEPFLFKAPATVVFDNPAQTQISQSTSTVVLSEQEQTQKFLFTTQTTKLTTITAEISNKQQAEELIISPLKIKPLLPVTIGINFFYSFL